MDERVLQNCTSENAQKAELRSRMRWIMTEESCKKRFSVNKFSNYGAYIMTNGQMLVKKFCQVLLSIDQSIFAA